MMMYYNVDSDNPVVRYELYSHKSKEMFETYSAVKFRKKLAKIEKGEKLHYYNTCAGGTHHALAPDVLNGIKEFCKDRGIIFQEGDDVVFGICTCP